ncbi:unnamed protein product, partial [marine sediment metagenome]
LDEFFESERNPNIMTINSILTVLLILTLLAFFLLSIHGPRK